MIDIKDVSLNLNKRQILDHVSLKLQEGKIYGLVGNNGSGKTMLMKCVCGFIHPTSGIVLADEKVIGKDVDYLPDAGVIIETPGFISYYSGLQNLKVLAGIKNKIDNSQIRDKVFAICDYYMDGRVKRNSRHIYDLYKLLPKIQLDADYKKLVAEIRNHRAKMSICHSAQEGVDVTKLLREIIDKEVYKSDYKEITTYFQNEPLEYDTAVCVIETVIDSGVF